MYRFSGDPKGRLFAWTVSGPSEEVWSRDNSLSAKRDAESLTPTELDELIGLSEQIETADVRRLEQMAELAQLRGIGLRDLQAELGIRAGLPDGRTRR